MKRSLLPVLMLSFIFCTSLSAQTRIEKGWGLQGYDVAFAAAAATDGGYIITGLTQSGIDTVGDIIVLKITAHGDTAWTLRCGGPKLEGGNSVIQTSDG